MAEKRATPRKTTGKPRTRAAKAPTKAKAGSDAAAPPTPALPVAPAPPAAPAPPVVSTRWTPGGTLVFVLVLLAVIATVVGGLWIRGDGEQAFTLDLGVATPASEADLRAFASPSRPVYWIGPPNSGTLEVTRTSAGAVYVRYLPVGVAVGDSAPSYTTIATYPTPDAYATLENSVRTRGFKQAPAANGGLAGWSASRATSVYLAFPESDYLIEVYDLSPRRARTLALGARVRRVP